jgi:hypothetical protein
MEPESLKSRGGLTSSMLAVSPLLVRLLVMFADAPTLA